jgi:hypothetical protein
MAEAWTRHLKEAFGHYRRVRDEIKAFIEQLPEALLTERGDPYEHHARERSHP